jgi:hypothetical protein
MTFITIHNGHVNFDCSRLEYSLAVPCLDLPTNQLRLKAQQP